MLPPFNLLHYSENKFFCLLNFKLFWNFAKNLFNALCETDNELIFIYLLVFFINLKYYRFDFSCTFILNSFYAPSISILSATKAINSPFVGFSFDE